MLSRLLPRLGARSPLTRCMERSQQSAIEVPPGLERKFDDYVKNTPLKVSTTIEKSSLQYIAQRHIAQDEAVLVYAERFCAHCHVQVGISAFQSRYHNDFYEFQSCRDMSDVMRTELYMEVRTDFRSRFNAMDKTFRIDQDKILPMSAEQFTWIKAISEIIAKKTAEEKGMIFHYNQYYREETKCAPIAETGPPLYIPRYMDFTELPVMEESVPYDVREVFLRMADGIDKILAQRPIYEEVDLTSLELYQVLCRMYNHQKRIMRQHGDAGTATDTGFGIYPTAQFIRHVLVPNCEYYFDFNANFVVRAMRHIEPGEEISIGHYARLLEEIDPKLGAILHPVPMPEKEPKPTEDNDQIFVSTREID